MQISKFVAFALNRLAQFLRHGLVRIHVDQNSSGIADEAEGLFPSQAAQHNPDLFFS